MTVKLIHDTDIFERMSEKLQAIESCICILSSAVDNEFNPPDNFHIGILLSIIQTNFISFKKDLQTLSTLEKRKKGP